MALLTKEASTLAGLNATYNAVSASDTVSNNGKIILHVVNADASPDTVAIETVKTVEGLAITDAGGSVPAGEDRFFGPFTQSLFNGADSLITVTHTNTTSVTMAIIEVD